MDAQLKAKWVEALRSGEYKQTKGTLRDGDSFCCLGVLCDITQHGQWVKPSEAGVYRPGVYRYHLGGDVYSTMYFPWRLKPEFGLTDDDLHPLMDMNDKGQSFAQIAAHIEVYL
jgi:hypothetical protein